MDVPFFWSQHYDVPVNYVGHAEKWDELAMLRFKRNGRTLAVASIFHDMENLQAEVATERAAAARGDNRYCGVPKHADAEQKKRNVERELDQCTDALLSA